MNNWMRFTLLLSVLMLTACGPYYRTFTYYDAPRTPQGESCVFQCEHKRDHCEDACEDSYDHCVDKAKLEGKSDYLDAKEDWLDKRQRCKGKLKAQVKGESVCNTHDEPRKHNYINTSHCRQHCGCDDKFDRCFQLCGGHIRHERRCVSNCEASH